MKQIWFECRTQDQARLDALRTAILAIDAMVPSAIADYWVNLAGPVGDRLFLERYFQTLED
ncbi:MAG: hypothetical protein JNK87_21980 [Bryobacterales bacterium]|nr:hypothetical protein [Bryobacterales bacterium]